jgi:hypothetical protein
MNKYQFEEPITGRLSRPSDHTVSFGNHEKVFTHITIGDIRKRANEKGNETRSIGAIIDKYMNKFEKEVLKLLETKKIY